MCTGRSDGAVGLYIPFVANQYTRCFPFGGFSTARRLNVPCVCGVGTEFGVALAASE